MLTRCRSTTFFNAIVWGGAVNSTGSPLKTNLYPLCMLFIYTWMHSTEPTKQSIKVNKQIFILDIVVWLFDKICRYRCFIL
jgi:hypothetical protein